MQQDQRAPGGVTSAFVAYLRRETAGGVLLAVAAVFALILANGPLSDVYEHVRDFTFGPDSLHLRLDVAAWTAEGLLTVFFYVAGAEVKRELTVGELADRRAAALPGSLLAAGTAAALTRTGPEPRQLAERTRDPVVAAAVTSSTHQRGQDPRTTTMPPPAAAARERT